MDKRYFTKKVVEWYWQNKRDLPWRNTKDPYKIWLSEIILQQTRVSQGLPYYLKFIQHYPTVKSLANAREKVVLSLWQGLGYYTRARNLHRCAKKVVDSWHGKFPDTFNDLKMLPGIGDYTAAAIASICFNEAQAVVDGNVFRVLARVFGIDQAINTSAGKKLFTALANELIVHQPPAVFNQAMMEFGALHCKPQSPLCDECPFASKCYAHQHQLIGLLPVKEKTLKTKKRYLYYLVSRKNNSLLMKARQEKDIWQGLYDFPLIEKTKRTKIDADEFKKLSVETVSEEYKHILSHQTLFARFIILSKPITGKGADYHSLKKLKSLPKPVLISRFLRDYGFLKE
jgi:A/G-specific adenine glycosylase